MNNCYFKTRDGWILTLTHSLNTKSKPGTFWWRPCGSPHLSEHHNCTLGTSAALPRLITNETHSGSVKLLPRATPDLFLFAALSLKRGHQTLRHWLQSRLVFSYHHTEPIAPWANQRQPSCASEFVWKHKQISGLKLSSQLSYSTGCSKLSLHGDYGLEAYKYSCNLLATWEENIIFSPIVI